MKACFLAWVITMLALPLRGDERPQFTLPLRIHLVQSETQPDLHTTLTEADVERILLKVNRVWSPAGIQFVAESVRRTQAIDGSPSERLKPERDRIKQAIPPDAFSEEAIDIFYVKKISPNGFYGGELIVVKDTARLKEVEGGIDEPLPRVTSHELGHALGLPHRQDLTNLMASGTTGFSLNEEEIAVARRVAASRVAKTSTPAPTTCSSGEY